MKTKEFLKFLEQEGLKDVLYTKCWWNKEHIPKNKDELRGLARKFGKDLYHFRVFEKINK